MRGSRSFSLVMYHVCCVSWIDPSKQRSMRVDPFHLALDAQNSLLRCRPDIWIERRFGQMLAPPKHSSLLAEQGVGESGTVKQTVPVLQVSVARFSP